MKCLICGRRSLPGAKLCADCRAARKRAFAATVTQPLLMAAAGSKGGQPLLRPSQSVAARVRRAAEESLFIKPPPAAKAVVPRFRRADFVLLVAALGTMAISGVYAAHRLRETHDAPAPLVQSDGADRQASTTAMSVAPTLTALKPAAAEQSTGPVSDSQPQNAIKAEAAKRPVARQRITATSAPLVPLGQLATVSPVAPVVEAVAPPPPNPLQAINDALVRCASGDFLDRAACELRVRQQYCSGYWGRVPQCPIGVVSDHGQ